MVSDGHFSGGREADGFHGDDRSGFRGGYGRQGGYGYHGGHGGWGWGAAGVGLGIFYGSLPFYYVTYWGADGSPYCYADDNYYQWESGAREYETVNPPPEVQRQAEMQSPDVIVYPKKGQSEAQQATDTAECHTWAMAQSGFDPSQAASTEEPNSAPDSKRSDYLRAQAACFEGRGYGVK